MQKLLYLGLGIRGLPSLDLGVFDRLFDDSLDGVVVLVVLLVELQKYFDKSYNDPA